MSTTFDTVDPSTEETIASVSRGDRDDVHDAVLAARSTFAGPLRSISPAERSRLLTRTARTLESRADKLAYLESRDTGKPLSLARGEISGCARYFGYYAGAANKIHGDTLPLGPGYLDYTVREPVGVTAHITPWNAPLSILCRSLAPALAAGNSAVVKPAEQAPLSALALALAEIVDECGWPAGTYNVVTGLGTEAGAALAAHPDIDSLTFTGSMLTGKAVLQAAAEHITPVVCELGGKSPQIVFDDADLDLAATDDPDMGPLISAAQRERVLGYIEVGHREGAHVRTPIEVDFQRGYFVAPTILDDVRPNMRVAREEIFGPVLAVLPFESDTKAAEIAHVTDYGLAAGIFTRNLDRALRFARDIRSGYVMVNEYFSGGVESPFGGSKHSGYGRERGLAALDNYTRLKTVVLRIREE